MLDYEAVGKLMAGAQSKTSSKNSQTAIRCWRCGQDKHGGACKPQDYMNYEKQLLAIDQAFQRVCPPEGWNSTYEAEIEEEVVEEKEKRETAGNLRLRHTRKQDRL